MRKKIGASIPEINVCDAWDKVPIYECNEPMVLLDKSSPSHISFSTSFYESQNFGYVPKFYARETVVKMLIESSQMLPSGYRLLIIDAWRPKAIQEYLFNKFNNELKKTHQHLSDSELTILTQKFVSSPSDDPMKPSPHLTGGSIDLIIIDKKGNPLKFGYPANNYSMELTTRYYENKLENGLISSNEMIFLKNRRLLYNVLTEAGFTNYPKEYWHFDYGNQFWAIQKGKHAIYSVANP